MRQKDKNKNNWKPTQINAYLSILTQLPVLDLYGKCQVGSG